jgi:HEAT repeat protein
MRPDFAQALARLASNCKSISHRTLAMLSAPSRTEVAAFAAFWATQEVEARRAIITHLCESSEDAFELEFHDLFRFCLDDADAIVRQHAVRGLWEYQEADLVAPLLRLLTEDPDISVRTAAATALGGFLYLAECDELPTEQGTAIREALEAIALDHKQPIEVVRHAIESLAHISDERIRGLIDWAYEHGDELLRVSAVFAMGRSAEIAWSDTVLAELTSPSTAVRYEAVRACGEIQIKRAVPPLIALTESSDSATRLAAIWSLGQIGGEPARRKLERLAKSKDEDIALAAEEAITELEFSANILDLYIAEFDGAPPEDEHWADDEDDETDDENVEDDEDVELEDDIEDWDDEPLDPTIF